MTPAQMHFLNEVELGDQPAGSATAAAAEPVATGTFADMLMFSQGRIA